MSSDKAKGMAASTRKTRQALVNKAPSKQKTLLDSFFVRTASKESAADSPPVAETKESDQITQAESMGNVTISPLLDGSAEPDVIIIDDSSKLPVGDPMPSLEPLHSDVMSEVDDSTDVINSVRQRSRSPSIVIIKEVSKSLLTTTRLSASQRQSTPEGKTRDKAIIVDSSPVKVPSKPAKPIHPFFGARVKPSSSAIPSKKKSATHVPEIPLYPDRLSQHVRGPQANISRSSIFPQRITKPMQEDADEHSYEFLKRSTSKSFPPSRIFRMSPSVDASSLSQIPDEHQVNHPAITQMLTSNLQESLASRRPWTDKWRPTCAQEVLGNEKSAIYLRNWLEALELQFEDPTNMPSNLRDDPEAKTLKPPPKRGLKRARVVRAVEKRRKRSRVDSDEEDDDWIVKTDDEDEHVEYETKDGDDFDDVFLDPPTSSPTSNLLSNFNNISPSTSQEKHSHTKSPDLGQLHNTILLTGPFGSGKTASVYACAEELGWDVFEVYPGIGRRNGANVDNLIGEVGKNHLVLQNRQSGDVLKNFLWKKGKMETVTADSSTNDLQSGYSPRKKSTLDMTPDPEEETPDSGAKPIRQSLILLEEVDILFKEDSNFWPAVLRIIKECKRPVICTCNDITLVPIDELPLQSILYFEPCPSDIAASYLQCLCAVEGHIIERELASSLYRDPIPEQQCSDIFSAEPLPKCDLRQTINALQVVCTTANSVKYTDSRSHPNGNNNVQNGPSPRQGKSLISMKRGESLSFLDGVLALDAVPNAVSAEFAGYLPSDDDEIGHVILHDRYAQDTAQFGMYDRHKDILTTAIRLSQELFDVDVKADSSKTQTFEEQSRNIHYKHKLVLQELCPMAVWARQGSGRALDYIPFIQQMVDADDTQEALEMQKKQGSKRSTRNSARSGYVRMIGISEEGRRRLSRLGR